MGERLFKVLYEDGTSYHGGICKWHLPQNGQPGKWMPPIKGKLVPCKVGYHLCREEDIVLWLGPTIFVPEYRGECIVHSDKLVVREARLLCRIDTWNKRTARQFACDCVERVLYIYEKEYPNDERPRLCIETARRFAKGNATKIELAAARDAAWAAWVTARDTARVTAVAWVARAAWETEDARVAGVAGVARFADAARERAERKWQTNRLLEYLDGNIRP